MDNQRVEADNSLCEWVLEGGVVCQDVACEKCGYSLKTLAVDGRCPECGEAVVGSVRAGRLCFADIDWMKRVRWGMRMPGAALVWWIVMVIGLSMGVGMFGSGGNFALVSVGCGALPAMTLVLLGVFLTTQAQGPVGNVLVSLTRYGWLARAATVVWVGCVGVILMMPRPTIAEGLSYWLFLNLPILTMLGFCVAVVGVMMHLREIGRVAGSRGLRVRCWLTVGCVVLGWGALGVIFIRGSETDSLGQAITIAIMVATLLGLFAALGALVSASAVMGRQIALARRVRGVG